MKESKFEKIDLAIRCGMYFAKECITANAEEMNLTLENFTDDEGKNHGNFIVTIKKENK